MGPRQLSFFTIFLILFFKIESSLNERAIAVPNFFGSITSLTAPIEEIISPFFET